ncbi:MAG: Amino acid permease [Eubacteriales bacterium]|jgi:basic amino acid/polyamine antiporter, APA family
MSNNDNGKIGLFDSSMILVGGMIGSAIFSLSGVTILNAGPASVISWIIAAVVLFVYALQTAELSTIYPHSGGVFVFPEKTLGKNAKQGRLWGWISAWAYLFGNISAVTFSAMYIGIYLGVGFPSLNDHQLIIGVASVVLTGVLNMIKVSSMSKVNNAITIIHVVTMGIFVVVAFFSGKWEASNFVPFFSQGTGGTWGFLSAVPVAMLAYGGIVAIAFMVGEIKNPKKTVPLAMTIAMVIVVATYLLMMISTMGLITAQYLIENPDMTYIPVFAAAFVKLAYIPWLVKLIAITAVLGLFTTTMVCMTLTARTFQACASSGLFPKGLAKISKKSGVPANAQLLTILICCVLAAFPSLISVMVNMGALCTVIVIAIVCLSAIAARKKNPDITDKFSAPGGNAVSILVLVILVACYIPSIIEGGWQLWAWTGIYYLFGMIIYYFATRKADKVDGH